MIIEWTKVNVKIIPIIKGNVNIGKVTLLPGNNEVNKEEWEAARVHVLDQIKTGVIKEHATQVTEEVSGGKGKPKKPITKLTVKEFNKLDIPEAEEIVKNTFNLKTLKTWKKKEGRDTVAALIKEQIELVEKHGTEAKKKKDRDK